MEWRSLAAFGWLPASFTDTEPHRLTRQIRPELLRIGKDAAPVLHPIPDSEPVAEGDTGV